jgi:glucuronate isomerase
MGDATLTDHSLTTSLLAAIESIPILDSHSHIDPLYPTARGLDDLLGYHYYTELALSAGMDHAPLAADVDPRDRCRAILKSSERFDNTVQHSWLVEIARTYLGFTGERLTADDVNALFDKAAKVFAQPDWEQQVWKKTKLEKVFLTNAFDDSLEGFDTKRYVPCLRTDDVVFHLDQASVRQRLATATGIEVGDMLTLRSALRRIFARFAGMGAAACAISLPPDFVPQPSISSQSLDSPSILWLLAQLCREFQLPFDLMIGVNRNVYPAGVHQGRDLFDRRTSLIQFADLFNAFPDVTFCVSVLTSGQNQELASYAWIFPNVIASGHWWYSNVPAFIETDLRARLEAVPKVKQVAYFSDAYKLEFVLPKFNMYRRCLARVLADEFVQPGRLTESQAVALARTILHDNPRRIFGT